MNPLQVREDEIGRKLAEAHASGELRSAASYGKPLALDEGWQQTPEEFRLGFKILKDAGLVPAELALFHARAELRTRVQAEAPGLAREALQRELSELEQKIALRLEALRARGAL
jgi:hypothetical protein